MPCERDVLVEGKLEELVSERRLLVGGQAGPVFCNQLPSLDCRQLAEFRPGMVADDLQERIERCWGGIVRLVQRCSRRLDSLSVGWEGLAPHYSEEFGEVFEAGRTQRVGRRARGVTYAAASSPGAERIAARPWRQQTSIAGARS